jgi:hypothetical protein
MLNKLSGEMVDYRKTFSVENLLRADGLNIKSSNPINLTFLKSGDDAQNKSIYEGYKNTDSRIRLQKSLNDSSLRKEFEPSFDYSEDYQENLKKFTSTFEWFIGQFIVENFAAFSSSFGVEISNLTQYNNGLDIGDFDSLVVLRNLKLLYIECKTGSQSGKSFDSTSLLKVIKRGICLHTESNIIFLEKGIKPQAMANELADFKHPISGIVDTLIQIAIKGVNNSEILKWCDCYFINEGLLDSKNTLAKLETVLRVINATRYSVHIKEFSNQSYNTGTEYFNRIGYQANDIGPEPKFID